MGEVLSEPQILLVKAFKKLARLAEQKLPSRPSPFTERGQIVWGTASPLPGTSEANRAMSLEHKLELDPEEALYV